MNDNLLCCGPGPVCYFRKGGAALSGRTAELCSKHSRETPCQVPPEASLSRMALTDISDHSDGIHERGYLDTEV